MAQLNSAQSIVDFFKSRGLPSDYASRKKAYEALSLPPEQTEYRGSPSENAQFLNYLTQKERGLGITLSPQNIYDVVNVANPQPAAEEPPRGDVGYNYGAPKTGMEGIPTALQGLVGQAGFKLTPEELKSMALQAVSEDTQTGIKREDFEAQQAAIRLKGQQQKEKLIGNLAARGLFFSGKRAAGLETIDADTIAKTFNVDRKYALMLAGGLETAAQKIAKEAQAGNQDAVQALGSLGFIITPEGRLIQKPSETRAEEATLRAEESSERAARAEERAIAAEARTVARFNEEMKKKDEVSFTDTQLNQGASESGMNLRDFNKLSDEAKGYIIFNKADFNEKIKNAEALFSAGVNPMNIDELIAALDIPEDAKKPMRTKFNSFMKSQQAINPGLEFGKYTSASKALEILGELEE